jgi:glycosyltransferase involved in cell wall biosynthesis
VTTTRALRVHHIIDNLDPAGTERQCVELVRGLSRLGVGNAVFYFRPGALLAELRSAGVTALRVPQASVRSARFPLGVLALARAIRRGRPDIVQTYGYHSNLRGLVAARLARVPVRVAGRRELVKCLTPAQRRADRWALRLAHRIVANSEAVRRQLLAEEGVRPDKVVVIRNGLALEPWLAADDRAHDNGDLVVGMVAHFRADKDHVTFLRAAREVLTAVPSVRFCLIGWGLLNPTLQECAEQLGITDRVDVRGGLEGEALRAAVWRFTVSVLASKSEGLPNAVLESMAASRPVVATAVGGTPELVDEGVTGFLVPPGDPGVLAERVVRLLKDPALTRTMGERGRERVAREFTIGRMSGQYDELYRDLFRGPRGRGR